LREESRLRVFENGVLRRVFGPKTDEITGEWSRLHNQIKKAEISRVCSTYWQRRGSYMILVRKPD
jgi:hypothetical protein